MMSFLSSYQLLNWGGLWLALLGPILILAYLYQGRFSKDKIASIMILRSLPKKTVIKQKIKLPLRYFLELFAILALTLALADIVKNDKNDTNIFILDTSLSMQAQTKNNYSRFEMARRKLEETLKQNKFSKVSLYLSTPRLKRIVNNESADVAIEALKSIKPSFSADQLASELPELIKSPSYQKIYIFSDQKFSIPSVDSHKIESLLFNDSLGNLFFSSANLRKFAQDKQQILARVHYDKATHGDISFSVKLYSLDKESPELLTSEKGFLGSNSGYTDLVIDLDNTNIRNTYRLELSNPDGQENAISVDDIAYVNSDISSRLNLLLVSDEPVNSGLEQLSAIKLTTKTQADIENSQEFATHTYDLVIFYKIAPQTAPQTPSLLILPPENTIFPLLTNNEANPVITSWLDTHPLTRYLRVALLKPTLASAFQALPWASGVINTEQGHILMAGESHGHRLAAVGFEIFPFEGAKTPLSTTLFLNLLNWLTQSDSTNAYGLSGSIFKPQSNSIYTILTPDNKVISNIDNKESYIFAEPGIYRIREGNNSSENSQAINAFYFQESVTSEVTTTNIAPLGTIKISDNSTEKSKEFVFYFLLAALLMLTIETLFFLRNLREKS
ncbi:MAG: VWA domain-containing protein [Deltaproteobacteria bacterium]|nr:VWA domain-containing protein [Deltaproteobacteria bacterium]